MTISDPILISSVAQFYFQYELQAYYSCSTDIYRHFAKHNCGCMNVITAVSLEDATVA